MAIATLIRSTLAGAAAAAALFVATTEAAFADGPTITMNGRTYTRSNGRTMSRGKVVNPFGKTIRRYKSPNASKRPYVKSNGRTYTRSKGRTMSGGKV